MSKVRRLYLIVSVLLLLFSFSAVSNAQDITVCAIVPTTEIEYFATLLNEYQMAGEARNIEVITVDSQNNPAREASSIEN
ncbi:MAG TPA: hypothetical protein PKX07_21285, partial [Aggregatilineales bacterium]|nr:hypothetical protein [Aggregatilineales bacterium]